MAKITITKRSVDAASAGKRDQFFWDSRISGFGLKVTPVGRKIYVFQYRIARPGQAERTSARRYTIGKHGNFTPDQARTRARELSLLVANGIDPREQEIRELEIKDDADRLTAENKQKHSALAFKVSR